ncbi:GrpB family protein [Pseudoalteromonas xiamenensis]
MSSRIIEVVDYRDTWPSEFRKAKDTLLSELTPSNVVAIHHIGSTAVIGLCAKPIIDILIEVNALNIVDLDSAKLEAIGYKPRGENGIEGRRYFQKGGNARTHHVHVFETGRAEVFRHLVFRDYLNTYPDEARAYGEVKRRALSLCNNNSQAYCDFKDPFVTALLEKAIAWHVYL